MTRSAFTAAAFLTLLGAPVAAADQLHVLTTGDGTGADAHILNRFPDSMWGSESILQLKNAALVGGTFPHDRKVYLRFDLSSVPQGLGDGALALTVSTSTTGNPVSGPQVFTVYGLDDGDPGEGWDESSLTWNNAPANDTGSATAMLPNAVVVAQFTLEAGGVPNETILVPDPRIDAFLASDTDDRVTFVIVRETYDSDPDGWVHSLYAKEHESGAAPELWLGAAVTDAPTRRPEARSAFELGAVFPHPVRDRARFAVTLAEPRSVSLDILDVHGRRIARAFEGSLAAGTHSLDWSSDISAGVYFASLRVAGQQRAKRFVVVK